MKKSCPVKTDTNQSVAAVRQNKSSGITLPAVAPFQSSAPVIQLYRPTAREKENKFLVKRKPSDSEFITATFKREIKNVGWVFTDAKGNEFTVASERNIKKEGEETTTKGGGKNRTYYDPATFARKCQHPGCNKSFKSQDALNDHIITTHAFPTQQEYPYTLFGGQSAMSHSLIKQGESFTSYSSKTGEGYHSEWRDFDERRKRRKLEPVKEEEVDEEENEEVGEAVDEETETIPSDITFTTSLPDFMGKGSDAPGGLYLTGDPHCGICSLTLDKAGLPVTYPTRAIPISSPMYNVPKSAPNQKDIHSVFPKKPKDMTTHSTFGSDNFPKTLKTRQTWNDDLRKKYKGTATSTSKSKKKGKSKKKSKSETEDDGEQYIKYMMQAMNVNRMRYNAFFGSLNEGQAYSRDQLKQQLTTHPIPQNPYTFASYCPSPLRPSGEEDEPLRSQESESEELSQSQELEEEPKKPSLKELLKSIDLAFKKFDPREFEVAEEDEDFFDPVSENNCLITAINDGAAASNDNVLMIRYLIFDQLDIPYGAFLPASPEVIYIIVKTLGISPARIEIFRGRRRNAAQIFIVASNYNIIELEGDEADSQEEEEEGTTQIPITHTGGNHFSYGRSSGRSKKK